MALFSSRTLVASALALTVAGCTTAGSYRSPDARSLRSAPPETIEGFEVYFVGDLAEAAPNDPARGLEALQVHLRTADATSAVVFLGDQLPDGLPDVGEPGRADAEARLQRALDAVDGYAGRVFFVAGDKDWRGDRDSGFEAVQRQEAFLEAALGDDEAFLPGGGNAGPADIKLADGIRLVGLDTAWWLREGDKAFGEGPDADVDERGEFIAALQDVLAEREDDDVLLVGHHPMWSNGEHGGYFGAMSHLLPLPVAGSLRPAYRRYVGVKQDLVAPRYANLRESVLELIEDYDIVLAGAHDQALQVHKTSTPRSTQHFIGSGTAARGQGVGRGNSAVYASPRTGFTRLVYAADGSAWIDVFEATNSGDVQAGGRLAHHQPIRAAAPAKTTRDDFAAPGLSRYADSTVTVAANPEYDRSAFYEFFLGEGYREVWAAEVEVPVFDLATFGGPGLRPVQRGGGMQTVSLRLEDDDGNQWVLRSVDKETEKGIPEPLRSTVAADIYQDQTSTQHPYSALPVAALAGTLGLHHTNPRYVWVPDDERFGAYQSTVANRLMLFEERPRGDETDRPSFGAPEDTDGTPTVYANVSADNDDRVDQQSFLRHRLFDIWINDWDRHGDQWRWAEFEDDGAGDDAAGGKRYEPIPRDRDQAFFNVTGLFPSLAKYVVPKLVRFDDDYGSISGLTTNGLDLDRRFLNELTRDDFLAAARELQAAATDAEIDAALAVWPASVQALSSATMRRNLRARRANLPAAAEKYYELLAGVVDVVGSDKHERFEVTRLGRGQTRVQVFKTTKEGEKEKSIYDRTFSPDDTEEIRLYGLGGRDRYVATGEGGGPRVRMIGGTGQDEYTDETRSGRVFVYDTPQRTEIAAKGSSTRLHLDDDAATRSYRPKEFARSFLAPIPAVSYNSTDGLFIGGGYLWTRYGYEQQPYKQQHLATVQVAPFTGGVQGSYTGRFVVPQSRRAYAIALSGNTPQRALNFYGLGNGTPEEPADFDDEVELARVQLATDVLWMVGEGSELSAGLRGDFADFDSFDRYSGDPRLYGGAGIGAVLQAVDLPANPRQGLRFEATADVLQDVLDASGDGFSPYGRLYGALTAYTTPIDFPRVTLALRGGGAHRVGPFPFYDAAFVGGQGGQMQTTRGFERERFAGRSAVFGNAEARLGLGRGASYFGPVEYGVLGFADAGRVFSSFDTSDDLHLGYGGGLWLTFFDLITARVDAGFSDEASPAISAGLGFFF